MSKHDDPKDTRESKSPESSINNSKKEFNFNKSNEVIVKLGTSIISSSLEISNFVFSINRKLDSGLDSDQFKKYSEYSLNTAVCLQRNAVKLIKLVRERDLTLQTNVINLMNSIQEREVVR